MDRLWIGYIGGALCMGVVLSMTLMLGVPIWVGAIIFGLLTPIGIMFADRNR